MRSLRRVAADKLFVVRWGSLHGAWGRAAVEGVWDNLFAVRWGRCMVRGVGLRRRGYGYRGAAVPGDNLFVARWGSFRCAWGRAAREELRV